MKINTMSSFIEETLQEWGLKEYIEKFKGYNLSYFYNNLLTKYKEGLRGMIGKLERYLDRKGLELNVEKTKVMRCRKGGWEMEENRLEMEKKKDRGGQGI